MFSTTPIVGIPSLRANVIAFLTTARESSEGIVTIITPSISGKSCAMLNGSSLVPGGKSITRMSISPQTMSDRNWLLPSFSVGLAKWSGVFLLAKRNLSKQPSSPGGL
jgi:hypothetical protein